MAFGTQCVSNPVLTNEGSTLKINEATIVQYKESIFTFTKTVKTGRCRPHVLKGEQVVRVHVS